MADEQRDYSTEDFDSVELYFTPNPNEAEFIKDMLDTEDVACFIRDVHISQFPMNVGADAQVRIVVEEDKVEQAVALIRQAIQDGAITEEGYFAFEE